MAGMTEQIYCSVTPAPDTADGSPNVLGKPGADKMLSPTFSTIFTPTQHNLYMSAKTSTRQEFLSEATDFETDVREQFGVMSASVSDGWFNTAARGKLTETSEDAISDVDLGDGEQSRQVRRARSHSAGAGPRQTQQQGHTPTPPTRRGNPGQTEVVSFAGAPRDEPEEPVAPQLPPRPAPPLYYGGDLTIGSLPSMPEWAEGPDPDDNLDDLPEDSAVTLCRAQMKLLIESLTQATMCAAREAINAQFAVWGARGDHTPNLERQCIDRQVSSAESSNTWWAHPTDRVQDDASSSMAGSATDVNVRSLESQVAQSILERHGLADGLRFPAPAARERRRHRRTLSSFARGLARARAAQPSRPMSGRRSEPGVPRRFDIGEDAMRDAESAHVAHPRAQVPDDPAPLREENSATPGTAVKTRMQVVRDRVHELTDSFVKDPGSPDQVAFDDQRGLRDVPRVFHACGLLSWPTMVGPIASRAYRFVILALGVAILGGLVIDTVRVRDGLWTTRPTCDEGLCWQQRGLLSVFPLVGTMVGTVSLSCLLPQAGDVHGTLSLLLLYMQKNDLMWILDKRAKHDAWPSICIWLLLVCTTGLGTVLDGNTAHPDPYSIVYFFAIVLIGLFVAMWTYCMVYVCRALSAMIDRFCCELANTADIAQAMQNWNILQAVMLKASASVEWSFIAMLLAVAFAVPLLLADLLTLGAQWGALPPVLPSILIMTLFVRVFFVAASITDKCARVPALVNSLCFGPGTEPRRQLLVEYISSSDAGFYVCDVRLTMGMALKFMYMWSIVAFGLSTNLFTKANA